MKDFVVFPGVVARGSAWPRGLLGSRTLSCVTVGLQDSESRGSFPQPDLWGSREPAFPEQRLLPASHHAKFLVTGLASASAPFWLLAGTILSCFCRDDHLPCLHVSLPSTPPTGFPGWLLHSHSGEGFCKAACTSAVVHQGFFCRCTIHHVFRISEVAHS